MTEQEVTVAFISDLHYAPKRNLLCPDRRGEYVPVLLAGLVQYLNRTVRPDLVLCGGDLINEPAAEEADLLTGILAGILQLLDMPCLAIRGNHDLPQARFTRHGVSSWTDEADRTPEQFEEDVRKVVRGCRAVADYAAKYGITTSVENHGRYFQASARIRKLVKLVDRPNYRMTIDVGNFTGIDELPQAALLDLIELTSGLIHFKDYYIRDWVPTGKGFRRTVHGRYLRGAIPGFGDMNMREIVRIIRDANFDGFISIEYEGKEDCLEGAELSPENVRAMFA